jgi:hypothetical protein
MTKTEAICKLIEIKAIATNFDNNTQTRINDILEAMKDIPSDPPRTGRPSLKVKIQGAVYASLNDACKVLCVGYMTARQRCYSHSPKFKDWEFVDLE